jgi:hypothetical protein
MSQPGASVAEDLKWELTILEVVHGFYLSLLQSELEDELLVPAGVNAEALHDPMTDVANSVAYLRRWMKLLDMAITPAKVRETLTENIDQDLAEALLRYYAHKRSHSDFDRDKTDFVASFLYRNPRVPGQWELKGYALDGIAPVPPFEIAAMEVIGEVDLPDLSTAHERLLNEFEHMREEIDGFRHFEEITDSGIIPRGRQLKAALEDCFYHPRALAVIAEYNAFFGKRFDELFKSATTQIKSFAVKTQQAGTSVSARVHGDVTIKQLAEVEDSKIMKAEYRDAQEQFRHVANLKKAVDARLKPGAQSAYESEPRPSVKIEIPKPAAATASSESAMVVQVASPSVALSPKVSESIELNKLKSVEDSIRAFVRVANPKFRQIVPMKFGNFTLSSAEADAYCADYLSETSFRADNARALVRTVAVVARISTEIEELKQKQNSLHLWKVHGESIKYLINEAQRVTDDAAKVMTLAQQRGLTEKVNAITTSLQRTQSKSAEAGDLLRFLTARSEG